ncbi:MAG: hypothetical protein ACLFUH_04595 [Bacteroidales bacterium]
MNPANELILSLNRDFAELCGEEAAREVLEETNKALEEKGLEPIKLEEVI